MSFFTICSAISIKKFFTKDELSKKYYHINDGASPLSLEDHLHDMVGVAFTNNDIYFKNKKFFTLSYFDQYELVKKEIASHLKEVS